jgi:hypothetical protein
MRVVAPRPGNRALLVDDARVGYGLGLEQDEVHDAFVERFIGRIYDYATDGVDTHNMYRPRAHFPEGLSPNEQSTRMLSRLGRYKAVLWSFNYTTGPTTGIWFYERESHPPYEDRRLLSAYLRGGGKLFLFGGRALAAILSPDGYPRIEYPKLPPQSGDPDFTEDSFIWNFLHVRSQIVGIDPYHCYSVPPYDHQTWRDGLVRCVSTNPAYPDLVLDPTKHDTEVPSDCPQDPPPPMGGIKDYEGILWDRIFGDVPHEAGLDTLYTSECYEWEGTPPSNWHGAVIAQRYQATPTDTSQVMQRGRLVHFLFQPYPFMEGPAIEAGTAAINWLMTGDDY